MSDAHLHSSFYFCRIKTPNCAPLKALFDKLREGVNATPGFRFVTALLRKIISDSQYSIFKGLDSVRESQQAL